MKSIDYLMSRHGFTWYEANSIHAALVAFRQSDKSHNRRLQASSWLSGMADFARNNEQSWYLFRLSEWIYDKRG